MQARELTPAEVAAGEANINSRQLTATQIQALVRQMDASKKRWRRLKDNKTEYEAKLMLENKELYFNYPALFQMHAEDRVDSTFFEMLNLKRRIERGEVTAEEASAAVGQALFQRYMPASVVGTPSNTTPRLSYEDYYKQFQSNS